MRYCEKCDQGYPDDYSICPRCGTMLADRPVVVDRQKVLRILRGLPGYKIILENRSFQYEGKNIVFDFIVLHEAGIFAFQVCDSYLFLEGNDKLRYWTVQERFGNKSVYQLERPVSLLEKDHYALDSFLRQHIFTKSFAFLIYPEDSGLEKIVSQRLNQMLTVSRMDEILTNEINHYGNVYSNDDIAKLNRIFSNVTSIQERPTQPFSVREKGHPRLARAFGIFALIVLIVTAGFFILLKGDHAYLSLPKHTSTMAPLVEHDSVQYTIAPKYGQIFTSFNQSDFDRKANRLGLQEFSLKDNGSVSCILSKDKRADILSSMSDIFDNDVNRFFHGDELPNITSIRTEDHIRYTIFVSNYDLSSKEYDFIFELISFGILNATVHDYLIEDVEVVILGQAGEHLRSIKPDDYIRQA